MRRRALLAGTALAGQRPRPLVAIQRCRTYGHGLDPTLRRLFDGIGGMGPIVKGRPVTVKIGVPAPLVPAASRGHWAEPRLLAVTLRLLAEAGAAGFRIQERLPEPNAPLDRWLLEAGWDLAALRRAASVPVEFINTASVPASGAFVSFAKMLEHSTAGLWLSLGNASGASRHIDLSILDGVETLAGGEGPWIRGVRPCRPGFVIAGTNPVSTDAVAAAALGFDPMAARGTPPFENADSFLEHAERLGLGSRDVRNLDVAGAQIADIRYFIRKA